MSDRTINIGDTFVNTIWVDSAKFGNEAHFMPFAAIIVPEMGQRARIEIMARSSWIQIYLFTYLFIYLLSFGAVVNLHTCMHKNKSVRILKTKLYVAEEYIWLRSVVSIYNVV
jgi:hypothetical protein